MLVRQFDVTPASARGAKRILLLAGGLSALALAVIGAILPVMPTTIFLLLALYCFARSSERLHGWLTTNRLFGRYLAGVATGRGFSPRLKALMIACTGASALLSAIFIAPNTSVRVMTLCLAAGMSTYIVLQGRRKKAAVRDRDRRQD